MTAAPGSGPGSPAAVEPGAAVLLIVVVLGILALLAGAVAAGRARRGGS